MTHDFAYFGDFSEAEYRAEQAREYYERGRWHDALRELEAAIEINPDNSNWLFNKGLTLDTLERHHEAVECYEKAFELNPADPETLNCLGVDYTRLGQYKLALQAFEELEREVTDYEPGYCNRIITYAEMGNHDKAEEMFYLARELKEHCPLCYFNMGNSLFSRHLYDRAIWCWQQTRNMDPNHPHINYRIAQGYWAKGEYQLARKHFLKELRLQPGDIDALLDTGILLLEMDELESAKEKFHRILELDSNQPQAYHYLGEILQHEGKLAQAAEHFKGALRLEQNMEGPNYRLGQCHLRLGQKANAREYLLNELKLSPSQPEVLLELGCMLEEVDAVTEAMSCFERVIEIQPEDPRGYHNLSLCYYLSGLLEQGIELSKKVLELEPFHGSALYNLCYAYLQKGDWKQADQYLAIADQHEAGTRDLHRLQKRVRMLKFYDGLRRLGQKLIRPKLSS